MYLKWILKPWQKPSVWPALRFGAICVLVDLPLHLVGQRHDDQGGPVHRGLDIARLEPVLGRELEVRRPRQLRHADLDAAVPQVQTVRVSLAAKPDHRHFLALQRCDRGILFVVDLCCHHSPFDQSKHKRQIHSPFGFRISDFSYCPGHMS